VAMMVVQVVVLAMLGKSDLLAAAVLVLTVD
jgi:hypothetical protein